MKSAVESGSAAAAKLGELVATHVIPRPHNDVEKILPRSNKEAGFAAGAPVGAPARIALME